MSKEVPLVVTASQIIYKDKWTELQLDDYVRDSSQQGKFSFLNTGDSVVIVAVNDKQEICLVESYRHVFKKWFWELPGGGIDDDDPLQDALRELEEEAGVVGKTAVHLGKGRVCNGRMTEIQHTILVTNLTYGEYHQLEDETRGRKFVSLKELDQMILDGELEDGQSQASLYLYKLWLQHNR